ncbi:type II toxin-antitoxin system RelE/ParE family toxin [Pricia sp.]|uniref:type II toxin-antitoxin system RelE/ParE family toxin n=1 Tax=Pricia sp. TaxID=2268138 RepID=UPI0035943523
MVQIKWTLNARDDLNNIAEYISKDSVKYAKLQIIRIKQRTQVLKSQMHIGKPVPEHRTDAIREVLEGRYRIIYKIVSEKQIDILTIHHSARDLRKRNIIK